MIITTHAPYLLDLFALESIVMVEREASIPVASEATRQGCKRYSLRTRNSWIRTIHAMSSLIELADEPGEAVLAIVKRFQDAAAKAEVDHGSSDQARSNDAEDDSTVQHPPTPATG